VRIVITIGIDPGLTGALAFIDSRGSVVIEDIPTIELPGNGLVKRKVDGLALARLVRTHCPASENALVVCEAVRTMGGKNNAVQTQGSLMRTLGAIEAVFEVLRFPWAIVEPQAWKRHYGLKTTKGESLTTARTLYPTAPLKLAKHHNRAEALLIAHYGREVMA
jgi:hypothetical protein